MIYAHMSNYIKNNSRVNQCQNQQQLQPLPMNQQLPPDAGALMSTPARAVKNTNGMSTGSATGNPAHPP